MHTNLQLVGAKTTCQNREDFTLKTVLMTKAIVVLLATFLSNGHHTIDSKLKGLAYSIMQF